MSTPEDTERRLKALESWAQRTSLQLGALSYITERFIAEHLTDMTPDRAARIIAELTNPYTFNAEILGQPANSEPLKRAVTEAAVRQVEIQLGVIAQRAESLRQARKN